MRKDMDRVVITPGRYGGLKPCRRKVPTHWESLKKNTHRHWDDYPTHEGMKRAYGWDTKKQSDLTGPLVGFLHHHIGQKWDDVWSEVCKNNDARNVIGRHVRYHILGLVDQIVMIDGEQWAHSFGGGWAAGFNGGPRRFSRRAYYQDFYVDLDGILRVTVPLKRRLRASKKPNPNVIALEDGTDLRRLNNIWFKVRTEQRPIDLSGYSSNWMVTNVVEKKTLNKQELKHYNLKNGIPIPKAQYRIQQAAELAPWERR